MKASVKSVILSVATTNRWRASMPEHIFETAFGERLSFVQPADTITANTSVQMMTVPAMMLHIAQAFFMSRMKRRRTSRIAAVFERQRETYSAT